MKKIKQFLTGSTNIYDTITPFYYFLKVFGLASFQLNCEDGKIRMKWKDYVLLFSSIFLGIFASLKTLLAIRSYLKDGTTLIEHSWKFQYLYQVIITVPIMIFGYIKRKRRKIPRNC